MSYQYFNVEEILDRKYNRKRKTWLYLIKWENYPPKESTWEPEINLENVPHILDKFHKKHEREQAWKDKKQEIMNRKLKEKEKSRKKDRKKKPGRTAKSQQLTKPSPDPEETAIIGFKQYLNMRKRETNSNSPNKTQEKSLPITDEPTIKDKPLNILEGYTPLRPDLAVHVPARIVGVTQHMGKIHFSILFTATSDGRIPSIGVFSLGTLRTQAPDLLAEYLLQNIRESVDN